LILKHRIEKAMFIIVKYSALNQRVFERMMSKSAPLKNNTVPTKKHIGTFSFFSPIKEKKLYEISISIKYVKHIAKLYIYYLLLRY
jgi:hypothetical protein